MGGGSRQTHASGLSLLWHLYWIKFPILNQSGLASRVSFLSCPVSIWKQKSALVFMSLIKSRSTRDSFNQDSVSLNSRLYSLSVKFPSPPPASKSSPVPLHPPAHTTPCKTCGQKEAGSQQILCVIFLLACFMYLIGTVENKNALSYEIREGRKIEMKHTNGILKSPLQTILYLMNLYHLISKYEGIKLCEQKGRNKPWDW